MDRDPSGEITLKRLKSVPPIRGSKVGAALKILEQFEFVRTGEDHVALTLAGREFSKFDLIEKMKTLRSFFLSHEEIQALVNRVGDSANGRVKARVVFYLLKESLENLTETEFRGFIDWAHWSELFHYDKKRDEISLLEGLSRNRPREKSELGPCLDTVLWPN